MNWQLIAHQDADLRGLISKTLRKALEPFRAEVRAIDADHIERAELALQDFGIDGCSLVIISSTMPADENASIGMSGREPTKRLIKWLKDQSKRLPVIVVASTPDDRLADFIDAFERTALVTVGVDFATDLRAAIGKLRAHDERHGSALLKLDIQLCGTKSATWEMRRSGGDDFETSGTLPIDADQLERVIYDSRRLGDDVAQRRADWLNSLGRLSRDLHRLLFAGGGHNSDCWERFVKHRERVGGMRHTRVRVTVNDETHPLLVEALKDHEESEPGDYWMLQAPVFRRYSHSNAYPPLFKDRTSRAGVVHCLVIEADGEPGNVPDGTGSAQRFDRLSHCRIEAEAIAQTLGAADRCRVEHLRVASLGEQVIGPVIEKLAERQWHIVHFCGHLGGTTAEDAGLVLRADRGGVLPVKVLVGKLVRTQLLFLSGCRSGSTAIVLNAIEQHVPALLGFQWLVDDQGASAFARAFYRLLFDPGESCHRYLEYAFMKARKEIHDQRPNDPAWAAPVLVMQMD